MLAQNDVAEAEVSNAWSAAELVVTVVPLIWLAFSTPEPVGASEAPVPTVMAADILLPLDNPEKGALVAATVPEPVAAIEAPVPMTIAA